MILITSDINTFTTKDDQTGSLVINYHNDNLSEYIT